ncbi:MULTISPECIES: P-loop NTPase fold protein [unclassified Arenibacter]|uniref:KAP family P-loop NTPase fold protein n=1 Tax=unclassified Arenibacter TaxID=2615047 RepID=UPI000E3558C0|nr:MULTISPECIES: P-loop NTPase fold protein [unclassified Arenibacter]MCM4162160.1 NTPase [Arenibacter sp. A80]RFT57773.1 NTPase [Arenibacter sp. P308M17]
MKIKHNDIVIPENNPFVNCKLGREQYADVLTSITENYSDGFVLAIDNKWGQGKTTFINMWRQKLKNIGFSTLYFNAWENDFHDDVILSLIAELEELREKSYENFDSLISKTAKFMKKAAPELVKGAVGKFVGNEAVTIVAEAAVEFTTDEIESSLKEIKERKKGILEFRQSLEKFVESVDNKRPIVFFIDELDRCRPNYSVQILEKVKHFFNVPGIVFVLSIDKSQLCHAIKGAYGSENFDSKEYLKRFIDLEYSIPNPDAEKVVDYYFEYFGIEEFYKKQTRLHSRGLNVEFANFLETFIVLILNKTLNLRAIEKIIAHFKIVLSSFSSNQYTFPEIILLIILLKKYNEDFIREIVDKAYTPQELVNKLEMEFKVNKGDEERQKRVLSFMFATFIYAYCNYIKGDFYAKKYLESVEGKSKLILTTNYDQKKFENIFILRNNDMNISDVDLDWLIGRIDFIEKMVG